KIVVIAGYQGVSYRREVTTLGRGGSDTTAVAMAAALGAQYCEICSDVDGVYTADPRVVPAARRIGTLTFEETQELAESGAKVLNAQAVEWARRSKIAIYARRTSDNHTWLANASEKNLGRETRAQDEGTTTRVRAVVGLDRVALVRSDAPPRAFAELANELHLPLIDAAWSGGQAHAVVPLLNVPDWDGARKTLDATGARVTDAGQALVSVVGAELGGVALPRFLDALASVNAVPATLAAGPLRIGATIATELLAPAQRALHATFIDLDD
ncbi:MAG TPA: aspartate kinase, partial [Polyangiaceae bacterium]|nr:aspartate kinase [Polyangiaceae bacterium]